MCTSFQLKDWMLQKRGSGDTANYLMKYKGIYRLKTEYDIRLNTFPREYNGQFADNDIFIDCLKGIKIFHFGRGILQCYIPSIKQGKSIVRNVYRDFINKENTETITKEHEITKDNKKNLVTKESIYIKDENVFRNDLLNNDCLFDIEESDEEVIFKFHSKHLEKLAAILKPKTCGADRSPFSTKNLPKANYEIPENDLNKYKIIVDKIGKDRVLELSRVTNLYLQSLATKKNTWENIKVDMGIKCLKNKEYIHSIGKWDDYIKYLENNL